MNRLVIVLIILLLSASVMSQESSVITDILTQGVELKVSSAQKIIEFDDVKSEQLKKLELDYLLRVQKVENCFLCNKKKRINKLAIKRDNELKRILERDQYLKYKLFEDNRIKNIPVHI